MTVQQLENSRPRLQSPVALAINDVVGAATEWRLWNLLAWQEIKQRYRRSTLGPFWLTISMAIQMAVMGALLTTLLNTPFHLFLPYICAGFVTWYLLSQIVIDGATAFVTSRSYIFEIKKPLTLYILQTVWRNMMIWAHNFVVFVAVAVFFPVEVNMNTLLFPIGLVLAVVSVSWLALLLAVVAARFRDVPMIIQSLFSVLFWLTPLLYTPDQLGDKRFIVEFNPLTHVVAVVREPLLGHVPTLTNWLVTLVMILVGWTFTLMVFARLRPRVYYWL